MRSNGIIGAVVLLLVSSLADLLAQTATVYTKPSLVDAYLAAHPNAKIARADKGQVTFDNGNRTLTSISNPLITYQQNGQWLPTKLQIKTLADGTGWLVDGAPISATFAGVQDKQITLQSGSTKFALSVPQLRSNADDTFSFQESAYTWTLHVYETSLILTTTVVKRLGKHAHTFGFNAFQSAVSIDAQGHLHATNNVTLSRPVIMGADKQLYPACSSWATSATTLSFSCDDTSLPDAAFPYVIDPSLTSTPVSQSCGGTDLGSGCYVWYSLGNYDCDGDDNCTWGSYQGGPYSASFSLNLGSGPISIQSVTLNDGLQNTSCGYPTHSDCFYQTTLSDRFSPVYKTTTTPPSEPVLVMTTCDDQNDNQWDCSGDFKNGTVSLTGNLWIYDPYQHTNGSISGAYNYSSVALVVTFTGTVATPTFSPGAGTYTSAQTVTISANTPGATIRYTTNGTTPSESNGTIYAGPITVSASENLQAIAYLSGWSDSAINSASYTITGEVATPTFSPAPGTYVGGLSVTISTTTSGAAIRYTTDNSTPTETHGTVYSGPVSIPAGTIETLQAIAYEGGWSDSSVASGSYTAIGTVATPQFSPPSGLYYSPQLVSITTATPGSRIRYTVNGSTPSETNGTVYSGPIPVSAGTTINAIAYKSQWRDSAIASANFVFASPTPPPSGGGAGAGTPPADSGNGLDPRRAGVRALGSYWGAAGENIDTTSGNVNFSVPVLHALSRSGWGATFQLNYNSQMWRHDASGTWFMGSDVGYGLGWKLQIGSITPVWSGTSQIDHYIFTDATGAEYNLTVNTNGVWTSQEGLYLAYDTNTYYDTPSGTYTTRLWFPDGSFWAIGCQSVGSEEDAGTLYPITLEDTNGNQLS